MQTVSELTSFRKSAIAAGMTDDEIAGLVNYLANHPEAGDEIQGTGGCRKLRFAVSANNKGKSGGARIITFYSGNRMPVFLIAAFAKSVKVSLSKAESGDRRNRARILQQDCPIEARNNGMSKQAFDLIHEGLTEALAVARGEAEPFKLHISAELDVKEIRAATGMTQKDFASTFGFGLDQLKQWEQGRARPVQALRAYLLLIKDNHRYLITALQRLQDTPSEESARYA
ncbi:hypothetical protein [Rhizobium sp. FY34]|uniref:hypothetical protein n=1 Tax=Rhizobium sp. FY34 TaxID=2562309 RepID=UPI001FEF6A2B|nr:hypothetical protein [Rhizobium sp. FY34]